MSYYDLQKVSLLVVDDSGFMAKLLKTILRGLAAGTVHECTNSAEVLDCLREYQPDAVFLDLEMPGMDGLSVATKIRKSEDSPNPFLPIIMMTARASRARIAEAIKLGVHEILAKPTSPKMLQDRLISILMHPRPMVQIGKYLVPEPRRTIAGPNEMTQVA